MDGWPSLATILYDGWVIRFAEGYTNRSNSVNPIYPSKIGPDEKIKYCGELFAARGLPAVYKIIGCDEQQSLDKKLESLNYQKFNETSVQVRETAGRPGRREGIAAADYFSDEWKESVIAFNKIDAKNRAVFNAILENITREKIVVHREADGKIVACGYAVSGGGYAGIFDIVVREEYRGKGYGGEIVETLLAEADRRGVKKAYLQVMLNNPAALRLYEKLGFKEIYRYWYRKKTAL